MPTQPIIFARFGKTKRAAQIGLPATTFLMPSLWLGPHRACFFIAIAAIITVWFWLCRRVPFIGAFAILILCNLIPSGRWR
jgi:hypothetical protein